MEDTLEGAQRNYGLWVLCAISICTNMFVENCTPDPDFLATTWPLSKRLTKQNEATLEQECYILVNSMRKLNFLYSMHT